MPVIGKSLGTPMVAIVMWPYLGLFILALREGLFSPDIDMPFSISSATTNTTVCLTKVYIEAGSFLACLLS